MGRPPRIEAKVIFKANGEIRSTDSLVNTKSRQPITQKEKKEDNDPDLRKKMKELALKKRQEKVQPLETIESLVPKTPLKSAAVDEEANEDDREISMPLLRPVFLKKEERDSLVTKPLIDDEYNDPDEIQRERQREAHQLLAGYRHRANASKDQDKAATEGTSFHPSMVDDTDGLDEEGEREAWKLRELLRMKRDRDEREKWELEKIEMERIRNMTEEERRQIDIQKQKEWEAKPKSQYKFLQKYYHKGAFFTDSSDPLLQRDYGEATGEDRSNKELLPQVMQVKNFGTRGRTKWTHLTNEDTSSFDYGWATRSNQANYRNVGKMGGMRGILDPPSSGSSKRPKQS